MSNNLTHLDNGVILRQQEIFILGKTKKNDLICMLGSDNDETAVKIKKIVKNGGGSFNLKGLYVRVSNLFAMGSLDSIDKESEAIITGVLKDSATSMPAHYDHATRTAYKLNNEKHIRHREGTTLAYLKYAASIIGNPKFLVCFVINKYEYLDSNFYRNKVKLKIETEHDVNVHNNDTKQNSKVLEY